MGAFAVFKDRRSKRKQETPTIQSHYKQLARKAALLRYICMVFVVVFAVYSFSFHSDEITMANFRYMLKFIDLGDEADNPTGTLIAFDGNEGNRGIIYKGDLAVLNEGGLTITGWDGDVLHKSAFSFDHPKMEIDGNYLYCYDLGGKDLKIFNSYQQLDKTPTFSYPILGLATSDNSNFAVISSEKGYRSVVYVYDNHFRGIYVCRSGTKYISSVDISKDGKEFLTAAYNSENANLVTTIAKYSVNAEGSLFTQSFDGEIPIGVYYTENGFCLMTSNGIRHFNNENEIVSEISFANRELLSGRVFGKNSLITYGLDGLSGGTETVVYDHEGDVLYSKRFATALSDTALCGTKMYALSPGVLYECDIESGEEIVYSVPTAYSSLLQSGERVILFSENQAEYFKSENFETKDDI